MTAPATMREEAYNALNNALCEVREDREKCGTQFVRALVTPHGVTLAPKGGRQPREYPQFRTCGDLTFAAHIAELLEAAGFSGTWRAVRESLPHCSELLLVRMPHGGLKMVTMLTLPPPEE